MQKNCCLLLAWAPNLSILTLDLSNNSAAVDAQLVWITYYWKLGSGWGSVGRAVPSNTRGTRFESSHRQKIIYIEHLFSVNCVLKIKKKRPGMAHFKKTQFITENVSTGSGPRVALNLLLTPNAKQSNRNHRQHQKLVKRVCQDQPLATLDLQISKLLVGKRFFRSWLQRDQIWRNFAPLADSFSIWQDYWVLGKNVNLFD